MYQIPRQNARKFFCSFFFIPHIIVNENDEANDQVCDESNCNFAEERIGSSEGIIEHIDQECDNKEDDGNTQQDCVV